MVHDGLGLLGPECPRDLVFNIDQARASAGIVGVRVVAQVGMVDGFPRLCPRRARGPSLRLGRRRPPDLALVVENHVVEPRCVRCVDGVHHSDHVPSPRRVHGLLQLERPIVAYLVEPGRVDVEIDEGAAGLAVVCRALRSGQVLLAEIVAKFSCRRRCDPLFLAAGPVRMGRRLRSRASEASTAYGQYPIRQKMHDPSVDRETLQG